MQTQRNRLRKGIAKKVLAALLAGIMLFTCFGNEMDSQKVYANDKMSIDGKTDDWKDIKDVLDEPEGIFDRIAAYCDKDSFNILFVVNETSKWCYFQVYTDTDNNPDTGFNTDGGGYEFMVENGTIYRSDSGEWPDTEVGKAIHSVSDDGTVYEIKVPFSIINPKGSTIGFHIGLLNDSWETVYKFPEDSTAFADQEANVTIVSDEPYISDFKCAQDTVSALTAPAMQDGVIATFSAKGGNGKDFKYSFVASDKNGRDNSAFAIDGNKLVTNKKLLAPGEYKVNVKVKSGVRAEIKAFNIVVGEPAPGSITEEIFTGNKGEWFIVDHKEAKDSTGKYMLSASKSQNKLFLMVESEEKDLDTKTSFVLDTVSQKGFKYFGCEGADYVIHAQNLYPVIADNRLGAPIVSVKEDYFENYTTAAVYLSDIENPNAVKVHAFAKNRDVSMPENGYVTIDTAFEMAYDKGYVYPNASYDAFTNPGTGWVCWTTLSSEDAANTAFDYSLAYMPLTWANLETSKGVFDWDNVEKEYHVSFWEKQGVEFVIRFVMDNPQMLTGKRANETYGETVDAAFIKNNGLLDGNKVTASKADKLVAAGNYRMDIPTWLFAELCNEVLSGKAENAGTFYNWPQFEVLGGAGFSPNYEAGAMISYHDACIKAIAKKFDGKAAYIEMGSLGHWGEMHTWPEADSFEEYNFGSGEFPGNDVIAQYGKSYTDAFKQTKVGIRSSYKFSREQKFGMFNDVFGQPEGSKSFLTDLDKCGDFWKTNYSGGEFAAGDVTNWVHDDNFMQTLSYLRDSHTTWLGPCSPCDLKAGSIDASLYRGNINYLQTKMGYRFRVNKVNKVEKVKAGSTINLDLTFENEGIAPSYRDYDVVITLLNADDTASNRVGGTATVACATSGWMPGSKNSVAASVKVSAQASGKYYVLVSMTKKNSPDSLLNLAMSENADGLITNGDKMYVLYTVEITK